MTASTVQRMMIRTLGVLILVGLWEANAHFGIYRVFAPTLPQTFFPSVITILGTAAQAASTAGYHSALATSVGRTLAAFGIAAALGLLTGLACARYRALDDLVQYPAEFFRQLPAVAVIPFAIMIFGIYSPMKIAVAAFGCFFPILVGTREGLKNVDPGLMLTARAYAWTGPRLLFGVMLPSALPQILAALRIALAIALILVVMAEMLVGGDGLGTRIVERERVFDFPGLYADTLLLGVVGVVLNQILGVISRRLHYWHHEQSWTTDNRAPASADAVART